MTTTWALSQIRSVLIAEAEAIRNVQVTDAFEHAVRAMRERRGKIVTTGMGKAGHVARRVAATLSSTGAPAVFLHPGEAAHGDLGMVATGDVILAFSTSGKTAEVLAALERVKHLGAEAVIGVTSHPDSGLRELCDIVLDMGVPQEPCHLGLVPSASLAAMAAIGDALALTLSALFGFTREEFGVRHHGGYLGAAAGRS